MSKLQPSSRLAPFRIALICAIVGSLWILFSDILISEISIDSHTTQNVFGNC
ncbi:MAG: hypothetical protein ACLPN1_15230 [Dissulfurispiraceae bacterium]